MKKIVMILFAVATCACEPADPVNLTPSLPPARDGHTMNDFDPDKGTMDYGEPSDGFGVNGFGNPQIM